MNEHWQDPETHVPHSPRSPGFWAAAGLLVGAQLVALWMLCSGQVEKAEARSAEFRQQQIALADCLQYTPGATLGSCTSRFARTSATVAEASTDGAMRAMPVNFTLR